MSKAVRIVWSERILCAVAAAAMAWAPALLGQTVPSMPTNRIAAIVNDTVITQLEIEKRVKSNAKVDLRNKPVSEREQIFSEELDGRVIEILQLQAAKEAGVSISEEDYISQKTRFIQDQQYESESQYVQFLETQGVTEREFDQNLRQSQETKAWLAVVSGRSGAKSASLRPLFDITITPKEMRDYFQKHQKDQFQQRDEIKLSVMQVYFRRDLPKERGDKELLVQRNMIKLREKADFATLARRDSQHPSKDRGGLMDWLPKDSDALPEAIMKAVFDEKAKEGDLLGPIEDGNSFWLVRIDARRYAKSVTFEEAQDRIRMYLQNVKQNRAVRRILAELLKNSYLYPPSLKRQIEAKLEGRPR